MTNSEYRSCAKTWRVAALQAREGKPLAHWDLFEKQRTQHDHSDHGLQKGDALPKVWEVEDEDFWRENLEPIEYRALRKDEWDTKASSLYSKFFPESGYFACRACGLPLFSAEAKFEPADSSNKIAAPIFGCCVEENVRAVMLQDPKNHSSQQRADTQCTRCRSHLGHVRAEKNPSRVSPNLFFREKHTANGLALSYVKDSFPEHMNGRSVVLQHPPVVIFNNRPLDLFE